MFKANTREYHSYMPVNPVGVSKSIARQNVGRPTRLQDSDSDAAELRTCTSESEPLSFVVQDGGEQVVDEI